MGLGTDLKSAQSLLTQLTADAADAAVLADAGKVISDLQSQISGLTTDLSSANSLLSSMQTDGANPTAIADCKQLITDLQTQLA